TRFAHAGIFVTSNNIQQRSLAWFAGVLVRLAFRGGLRGRAIAIGLTASLVAFVVTTAFAVLLLSDPVCNRPPALA
ncbi:MAG TPA: hypothetical protein VK194_03890, partial [Candidatus Deferrimicrobium sp.]|nr:hypothetical protein [Candidatus Deferrimicrobium sp.]